MFIYDVIGTQVNNWCVSWEMEEKTGEISVMTASLLPEG